MAVLKPPSAHIAPPLVISMWGKWARQTLLFSDAVNILSLIIGWGTIVCRQYCALISLKKDHHHREMSLSFVTGPPVDDKLPQCEGFLTCTIVDGVTAG